MVGYPRWLNTREDYLYVREHFPREQWEPAFQALLDEHMVWMNTGKLVNEADGIVDETHKVITVGGEEDGAPVQYYQYEYREDPNCKMFRLGFAIEEVENSKLTGGGASTAQETDNKTTRSIER